MQNWNTLIEFIKLKLGVPTNIFEFTDDEIKRYIQNHVLPHMSNYLSDRCWIKLTQFNIIRSDDSINYDKLLDNKQYLIPVPEGISIIDVYNVYTHTTNIIGSILTSGYMLYDPRDTVISNTYADMMKSMRAVKDYMFRRPDMLILGIEQTEDLIIECRVTYTNLDNIPSDFYHDIFKYKCLGEIMSLCASQRSKYENLSTQFGPIPINWERLESKAEQILQEVDSKLDAMPPEILIGWMDD